MALKMGRLRPVTRPRYYMVDFLRDRAALPPIPDTCNWGGAATASIDQIYGNDTLGDCVIAGNYHGLGVWTGNAGDLFIATKAQIEADYGAIGGYVPGKPATDQGCDEQVAFGYYTTHGYANGSRLEGWMGVDATQPALIKEAIFLFESAPITFEMPSAWMAVEPTKSGWVWDVAGEPDTNLGHYVTAIGYNTTGAIIASWGMYGFITWAALAKYSVPSAGGGCYTLISNAQLVRGIPYAANGYDMDGMVSTFNSMGGHLPVPVGAIR